MQRGLFNTNPHQLENASSCLLCDTYLSLRGSSTKRVGIYLGIYHQVILIRVHTQASPCSAVLHRNECQKAGGGNSFYRRTGKLHAPDVPSDPLSREPGSLRWCARVWVHPRQSSPTLLYARYHLGLKHNYIIFIRPTLRDEVYCFFTCNHFPNKNTPLFRISTDVSEFFLRPTCL